MLTCCPDHLTPRDPTSLCVRSRSRTMTFDGLHVESTPLCPIGQYSHSTCPVSRPHVQSTVTNFKTVLRVLRKMDNNHVIFWNSRALHSWARGRHEADGQTDGEPDGCSALCGLLEEDRIITLTGFGGADCSIALTFCKLFSRSSRLGLCLSEVDKHIEHSQPHETVLYWNYCDEC